MILKKRESITLLSIAKPSGPSIFYTKRRCRVASSFRPTTSFSLRAAASNTPNERRPTSEPEAESAATWPGLMREPVAAGSKKSTRQSTASLAEHPMNGSNRQQGKKTDNNRKKQTTTTKKDNNTKRQNQIQLQKSITSVEYPARKVSSL